MHHLPALRGICLAACRTGREKGKGEEMKYYAYWLALFALLIFLGNFFLIAEHEEAHKQIFENFGVTSRIEFGIASGKTIPLSEIPVEHLNTLYYLHSLNEIVGYHATALFNGFAIIFFIGTLFLKAKEEKTEMKVKKCR